MIMTLGLRVLIWLLVVGQLCDICILGQNSDKGLSNEDMLAHLQANSEGEGSFEDWAIARMHNAESARQVEQQYEKLRLERGEEARQQATQQLDAQGNSLETKQLFHALMTATDDDHLALEGMLRSGGDANRVNRNGETLLHAACIRGEARVVQLLLTAGADPNARANRAFSAEDMTPLAWCVHAGHFDATEAILDSAKTDVNLHFVVKRLGARPLTAMDLALRRGDQDVLALLLEHKAQSFEELSREVGGEGGEPAHDIIDDEAAFQRFLNLE